jgi:multiple sugar transport system substrate-binding protein
LKTLPVHPRRIYLLVLPLFVALLFVTGACQQATDPNRAPRKATSTPTLAKSQSSNSTGAPSTPRPTPTPALTPEPVSTLDVNPAALNGVKVNYWHTWDGEAQRLTNELVDEFNASNPWGIQVEASYAGDYDSLSRQILQASPEDELPDLATAYNHQALNWDAQKKLLVDLSNYVNDPFWGLSAAEQSDFYPVFWDQAVIGDKRIGVPALGSGQMIYYNTTWAKQLGFNTPPSTAQEFKEQACEAARANLNDNITENDKTGGWIISTEPSSVLGWLYAFGAPVSRPDGRGYRLNTPEVRDALGFLRQLYEEGCAWLPENQTSEADFAQRLGLFATGSVTEMPFQEAAFKSASNPDGWTVIPFPAEESDAAGDTTPVVDVYGPSLVMLQSTPQKQLASWLFSKWLLAPENQARWVTTTGSFPLQESVNEQIISDGAGAQRWQSALELLQYAHSEPKYRSWDTVRWALSDASTQLFRWYFTMEQLPDTVSLLDKTAAELHQRAP